MKRASLILAALALLFAGVTQAKADVLYSQPLTSNPQSQFGLSSDGPNSGSGNLQELADNFQLSSAATLEQVLWYGAFQGSAPTGPTVFRIYVYQNSVNTIEPDNTPGSILSTESDAVRGVNTGLTNSASDRILSYSLDLANPVNLAGGQELWLSILADDSSVSSIWAWQTSDVGDRQVEFRDAHSGSDWAIGVDADLAFTLDGSTASAAPEPAALTLLGIGMLGLLGYVRRRRNALPARV